MIQTKINRFGICNLELEGCEISYFSTNGRAFRCIDVSTFRTNLLREDSGDEETEK